jgi:hypothetical protein
MKRRRPTLLTVLLGIAAGGLSVLLALIGFGWLVLPSPASPQVTVTGVHWRIIQGENPRGLGWFGPEYLNSTSADGFPLAVSSGGSFSVDRLLSNVDLVNHTVYTVTVGAPFRLVSTDPPIPTTVPTGEDDYIFGVTVSAPNVGASESVPLNVTIDTVASVSA